MTKVVLVQPATGASRRCAAKRAGAFYLLTFISGIAALFVRRRLGIMFGMAAGISYVAVTLLFYALFKPVDRNLSLVAACLSFAGILNGPLRVLHLPSFPIHSLVFFGGYCLLLSWLIYRSQFLPRLLAFPVALAGLGWLAFLFPSFTNHFVPYVYAPGVIGEGALTLWLLVFGIDEYAWLQPELPLREVEMKSETHIARKLGALLILHLAVGLVAPFAILHAVLDARGFLLAGADNAIAMRTAVFLAFVGSALAIGIAVTALPIVSRNNCAMGLWLVALAVAGFTLQTVDNGRILAMLSLSQEYAKVGSTQQELFQALAVVVGAARKWSHFTYLLVAVSWIFLLFAALYRFRLVPRVLSVLGLVTSLLQIAGVSVRVILGFSPEMRLAMPLGPCYLALALWLIVKGINIPDRRATPETQVI